MGGSIGGLLAYLILPQARGTFIIPLKAEETSVYHKSRYALKEILGLISAVLLSPMVVMMLARIPHSQFLIKVSVSDFWSGIAIGFVTNYAGAEILNQITKKYRLPATKDQTGTTGAGQV